MTDDKMVPKAGTKTTEFWVSLVILVLAPIAFKYGFIDQTTLALLMGLTGGGYVISRGIAKN